MPFFHRVCLLALALLVSGVLGGAASPRATAQELNCRVTVNYESLSGSEFSFLSELERKVEDYLNQESWTEDRFQDFERIDCRVQIIFQQATTLTDFQAQLVVSGRRPVYATTQQTPVVSLRSADWQFSYNKGEPIVHDLERYDGLATVLDFYAFILLGYDYDTFSEEGGTRFFEEARKLAQLAQSTGAQGWTPVGGRGRVTLVTQLLDPRYQALRQAFFTYHFGALDRFVGETGEAREVVLQTLEALQSFNNRVSRRYVLDLFFAAKYRELAALFEGSPLEGQAYALLSQLDPAHMSTYESLR